MTKAAGAVEDALKAEVGGAEVERGEAVAAGLEVCRGRR